MSSKFSNWLFSKLEENNWSQSDLARESGLTRQAISYYLGEKSKSPDEEALRKIARAFHMPPEQVFRVAGLLPPKPNEDEWVEEMSHKLNLIPPSMRNVAGKFIESMIEGDEQSEKKPKHRSRRSTT